MDRFQVIRTHLLVTGLVPVLEPSSTITWPSPVKSLRPPMARGPSKPGCRGTLSQCHHGHRCGQWDSLAKKKKPFTGEEALGELRSQKRFAHLCSLQAGALREAWLDLGWTGLSYDEGLGYQYALPYDSLQQLWAPVHQDMVVALLIWSKQMRQPDKKN